MIYAGSPSRLRLYTRLRDYFTVAKEFMLGRWNKGDDIGLLEQALCKKFQVKHTIMVPLARVGIYLSLKHKIRPGQKVILSPYTIAEVVNMVIAAGGIPVFADIDRNTCNIAPRSIKKLLTEMKNEECGAVLATHFYGCSCDVVAIKAICDNHEVPLIEDAAQAFGLKIDGKASGTHGNAGIYSFGLFKNVTSFYGGAIVTNDDNFAQSIRKELSGWPELSVSFFIKKVISGIMTDVVTWPPLFKSFSFRLFRYGLLNDVDFINNQTKIDIAPTLNEILPDEYRHRLSPMQARLILPQINKSDDLSITRQNKARIYDEGFKNQQNFISPPSQDNVPNMYWYYTIQCDDREKLVKFAMKKGRDITMSYHRNCSNLPCYSEFYLDCPNAEKTAHSLIYLPLYPDYSDKEIHQNIAVINEYFQRNHN
ncbi:MAG: DegT/DnrJ/EryC1/StrS aminotransferase family protein [Halopseudomonas aestusnigri]